MSDQDQTNSSASSAKTLRKHQYVDSVMMQMKSEGKRFTSDDFFDYAERILFYCTDKHQFAVEETNTVMGGIETKLVTEASMRNYLLSVGFVYPEDDPGSHLNRPLPR